MRKTAVVEGDVEVAEASVASRLRLPETVPVKVPSEATSKVLSCMLALRPRCGCDWVVEFEVETPAVSMIA